jgi:MFS family permease
MEYIRLFIFNRKLLGFGIVLTFFSCFGKTFLISQYVPFILREFHLSNTAFGTIYAIVTIMSGFFIIFLGRLLDRHELLKFSCYVTVGLMLSTFLLSISGNIIILGLALLGLRLSGQGLLNHTSQTAISRFFKRCRGKAISLTAAGHSAGEALLPVMIIFLISFFGWRNSLLISGIFIGITLLPLIYFSIKRIPKVKEKEISPLHKKKIIIREKWTLKKLLHDNQFYFLAPNVFILPFITTAILFYLMPLAKFNGWSSEWISFCFIGFGLANFSASFLAGFWIDRISAVKVLPFTYFPLIIGLSCILIFEGAWTAPVFLIMTGATIGLNLTIEATVITEVFGVKNLATVKSVFSTLAIIASALGPLVVGLLLDHHFSFSVILLILLILLSLLSIHTVAGHTSKHRSIRSIWNVPALILIRKNRF